jgi:DNA-binding response OmpR family regulator
MNLAASRAGAEMQLETIRGNALIVEDDPDCGAMILRILSIKGYGVRLVRSRDAALHAMHRYLYDYILLDYAMPGMSVEEFVKHCQCKSENIILISAVVDPAIEATRLGLKRWIPKPFDSEQLINAMRDLSSGLRKAI